MAGSSVIRVMLSSRCNDVFPASGGVARTLSEIRKELKRDIEAIKLFGRETFEVWINEETPPKGGTWDSWEVCIEAVKDCDLLIVLSNGNAGWAKTKGEIGICHAELMTGLARAPAKVHFIDLGPVAPDKSEQGQRNKKFQDYIFTQSLFRGAEVRTISALTQRVREAIHDGIIDLAQRGVREASSGKYHSGQALDWSRMDFVRRRDEMVRVVRQMLLERPSASEKTGSVFLSLAGTDVLFQLHGIPAALSIGAAKEMVGQPFLRDHTLEPLLKGGRGGPVHLIACHKGITEASALRLLGFPDATVVTAPFGIYLADDIQKVQIALLKDCRDEASTVHGAQRFFEWLDQTGEAALLARRAQSRARIIAAIAKES